MAQPQRRGVRKLVTLPPDLAERVESFRATSGATSESDALKMLIEDGLKLRDTPADLIRRCRTATEKGQSIGDIINLMTSDHPLVQSTTVDGEGLAIYLRLPSNEDSQRFFFSRNRRVWSWEHQIYNGEWELVEWEKPKPAAKSASKDLDDEIPF